MSINIPDRYSKEEFNKLTNKILRGDDFSQYQSLFKDNYKKVKGTNEYLLKEGVSIDVKKQIDYVLKRVGDGCFDTLKDIAEYFRMLLEDRKYIVLFAYNGTGKTRLSSEFKSLGQQLDETTGQKAADTLYYNAFTEDLFYWDNDLEKDFSRDWTSWRWKARSVLCFIDMQTLILRLITKNRPLVFQETF